MKMKARLVGFMMVVGAACAFVLAPVVASACECKKNHCNTKHQGAKQEKQSTAKQSTEQNAATTEGATPKTPAATQ